METMVMAARADRPEHTPQAEPVLVVVDGDQVQITLDDGIALDIDRRELLAALGVERGVHNAAAGRAA